MPSVRLPSDLGPGSSGWVGEESAVIRSEPAGSPLMSERRLRNVDRIESTADHRHLEAILMKHATIGALICLTLPVARTAPIMGQDMEPKVDLRISGEGAAGLVLGHPFTAIKYSRRVRVLPDGKRQFLRNERYPTRIARDADGRLMMQVIHSDDLNPECDRLELPIPPICPSWGVQVIDPVAHRTAHWVEGEIGAHVAVDFPFPPTRLEEAAESTSNLPELRPDFTEEDGKVSMVDLGNKDIEGIQAHGVRWTLRYDANQDGATVRRTRIHEVWTSAPMQLIIRVVNGDPNGEETVWGLKKISVAPEAGLFRPPDGYEMGHRSVDENDQDYEYLKTWFEK
jgi:hypothetical protein